MHALALALANNVFPQGLSEIFFATSRTYLLPLTCCGSAMELQWKCLGSVVEVPRKCCGSAIKVSWKCPGIAL